MIAHDLPAKQFAYHLCHMASAYSCLLGPVYDLQHISRMLRDLAPDLPPGSTFPAGIAIEPAARENSPAMQAIQEAKQAGKEVPQKLPEPIKTGFVF